MVGATQSEGLRCRRTTWAGADDDDIGIDVAHRATSSIAGTAAINCRV
jgi:hypothetical protein